MKKLLLLVLTLAVAIMFTACGEDNTNGGASSNNQSGALTPDTSDNSSGGSLTSDIIESMPNGSSVNPGTNTPTASDSTEAEIDRDKAIDIALKAAGISKDKAYDLDAELDREQGELVWEVDFETKEMEYSYDIDANNGNIIKQDKEPND